MVVGKFGPKTFEVSKNKILTPTEFSLSGDLDTSSEEASKKKPSTTIKGPGLLKISFEIKLLAVAGINVQSEIDSWMEMKDSSVAYPFILCGKAISLNGFLLKTCSASDYVIVRIGSAPVIAAATLKLEFEEYVRPGTQSGSAKKKTAAKGSGVTYSTSNPYKTPTVEQKAADKRVNERISGQRW